MYRSVNLTYVSEKGARYTINNTLNFGLSLLISNLGLVQPD